MTINIGKGEVLLIQRRVNGRMVGLVLVPTVWLTDYSRVRSRPLPPPPGKGEGKLRQNGILPFLWFKGILYVIRDLRPVTP